MLFFKAIIGVLAQVLFFGLLLLLPARTWFWEDANIFLLCYLVMVIPAAIYQCLYYPKSIEARLITASSNQPKEDKLALLTVILGIMGFFVFIPIDVFHLTIFLPPSFAIKFLGLGMAVLGFAIIFIAQAQNAYAEPIVEIQEDRGQVLIDTGLYAHVRHPMYSGGLIFFSGAALWLGSIFTATFGAVLLILVFLPRVFIEEKTLKNGLKGYEDYMKRVRSRIIPKLF